MSKYYTTIEAAKLFSVTPARVRQFILEGRLESEKFGRDHLISEGSLEKFLRNGRKRAGRPSKK